MSHTFRRDPDASPFATRRESFKRADKREAFEERREARRFRAREQVATLMDRAAREDRATL